MRTILRILYRPLHKLLAGRWIGKFPPLRAVHRIMVSHLMPPVASVQGHKMILGDHATGLALHGVCEPVETDLITRLVKQGDVALDLGANIGYFTLLLARLVGPAGKVFAFEPDPSNFALLKNNVQLNGYQNVVLVQKAVSDTTGTARLYLSRETPEDHRIYDSQDHRQSLQIETIRLDDYFSDYRGGSILSK